MASTSGMNEATTALKEINSTLTNTLSGNKSINYRLGLSDNLGAFGLTATKMAVDNTGFFALEYGCPVGGIDITLPTSAVTLGMASTSTNDTNTAGTGARSILITGLNEFYNVQSEVVNLNGQTEVNSVNTYIAVNELLIIASGSTGWNEGTIYCGSDSNSFVAGIPDTDIFRTIGIDDEDGKGVGISTNSTYTIPAGLTSVPLNFKLASNASITKSVFIRGIIKPFGLGELTIGNLIFGAANEFTFDGFPSLSEKSSLIIRAKSDSASVVRCTLFWEWNTVKNSALE